MPPITAATIATIARDTGRSRTDRTVAACVLGVGAEDPVELRTKSCAEPGPQKVGGGRRVFTLGDPHPNESSAGSVVVLPIEDPACDGSGEPANGFLVRHSHSQS